ncbi:MULTISPECIES: hypothetical protein [Clostridium]|uniref:Uncharacterized protein n=1 Tax=Clostridium aquiflavi TaxID=3073603 RepID=A0ABU1EHM2_9CLOT|nr:MULTISPECIES: hypothetical protein [unclassified Clostridium]MDR5587678.1 hypothetical protein [Clostridium sp. 5N-1]NFG63531.1 hypothetical protein [Clostridium botulinum]NFQ08602.1 hypothetical protein [Clostridium botulinum]
MGKCPFWSSSKEYHECYDSCPMLTSDIEDDGQCIFKEYLSVNRINFKDIIKEEYSFLKKSIYNDESNY